MPAPAALAVGMVKKKLIMRAVSIGLTLCVLAAMGIVGLVIAAENAQALVCSPPGAFDASGLGASGLPGQQVGVPGGPQPGDPDPTELAKYMAAKRYLESRNNYTARYNGPGSDASGAYQYISSTWNAKERKAIWSRYGNYPQAYMAPPHVQDEVAKADFVSFWHTYKNWFQVSMVHYYPRWVNDPSKWDTVPRPDAGNRLTLRQYAEKVLKLMEQPIDAPAGTSAEDVACREQAVGGANTYVGDGSAGSLVLAAASKYIGIGYKWGGGRGTTAQSFAEGMDCSGFTLSVMRDLGIKINGYTGAQERNGQYVGTDLSQARPGDLIFTGDSGRYNSAHVLIYHSFQNGKHMVLESRGGSSCGVNPKYGVNPRCRGIGPPHPYADRRKIVNIRRIVCGVDGAGKAIPCPTSG